MNRQSSSPLTLAHAGETLGRTLGRRLVPHDVVILGFTLYLWLRSLAIPNGAEALHVRAVAFALFAIALGCITLARGGVVPAGPLRALVYRFGLLLPMAATYFALRRYLPALGLRPLDVEFLALDRMLFGETPAVRLEQFATVATVEWFALCYSAYFLLLATHVVGTLLFDRGKRAAELLLGLALVTAVGQSLYTVVPGYGPYAFPQLFEGELPGGPVLSTLMRAVSTAGAGLDIFPSLHTAHPLLIALHAFRHRRSQPYRASWLPTALLSANILVSTMFLRWHYAVDVLAGVTLAAGAHAVAVLTHRTAPLARRHARSNGDELRQCASR